MSLVGNDQTTTLWAKDCVSQIKEQNKVNSAFEDVIGLYNNMVEKEKKLYYANVAKEEQNNVLRKKIADLEKSISQNSQDTDGVDVPQLRRELKDGLERVAVLSETIVARGQKLKELELEESNLRKQVEEANKLVQEKENLYVERIKKKEESDVMYNTLYDALLQSQIKLVKVEEKMRDDRKENKQIKMKYQQKMEDNNKTLHSVVSQSFSTSLSEMLPALFSTPESTSLSLSKSDLVIEQPANTPEEPTLPCKARENFQIFSGEINSICFSKSGSQLVMGGDDQICRVWDTNPFKLKQQLTGADRSIMCVDFSKNEELVLASSIDHSIRVYTLKIGRIKYNLMGHLGRVFAAKFTEDSKQIFSGSYDKTFRIWDITRGFCNKTIWCNSSCNDLVINGQQIISAHTDKALRFWDVASGKATHEATDLHNLQISGLALSPDGNTVLTCSNDKTLKLVDIRTYGVVSAFTHENYVSSLPNMRCCFSPNGKNICTGGDDGSIFIWDVNNPKEAAKKFGKRVHKNAVLCVSWTGGINGASNLLASCDKSGTFALWG